jgi:hypothetical protein
MISIPLLSGLNAKGRFSQAARVDSSQRPLAGCVAHSGGAPLNALDVSFDRVQPDVPHGPAKSTFLGEPSLLECNRAAQRCLHRERSTRTNVRVNELFKLAVDHRANGQGDTFVGASVQFRRPVIRVEDVIDEI